MRDPRQLDQNPVVIDPANVDAVLNDRPTPVTSPRKPPLDDIDDEDSPRQDGDGNPAPAGDVPTFDEAEAPERVVDEIPDEPELDIPYDDEEN
ncbi:hypothetical protein [Bosea sp. 117]|uniref:hypothetical protein n=1 Tax=Bosea sp. 117 TaxID=1125973 RepID=UPI0006900C91|nr:hypothetical protein [Bosea sp. 117]